MKKSYALSGCLQNGLNRPWCLECEAFFFKMETTSHRLCFPPFLIQERLVSQLRSRCPQYNFAQLLVVNEARKRINRLDCSWWKRSTNKSNILVLFWSLGTAWMIMNWRCMNILLSRFAKECTVPFLSIGALKALMLENILKLQRAS